MNKNQLDFPPKPTNYYKLPIMHIHDEVLAPLITNIVSHISDSQ